MWVFALDTLVEMATDQKTRIYGITVAESGPVTEMLTLSTACPLK